MVTERCFAHDDDINEPSKISRATEPTFRMIHSIVTRRAVVWPDTIVTLSDFLIAPYFRPTPWLPGGNAGNIEETESAAPGGDAVHG